jgi:hypothetical protein
VDDLSDESGDGALADVDALLAALRFPADPLEAVGFCPELAAFLEPLDGRKLALRLAGLATDPALQAQRCRLDMATRLALAYGRGTRAPRRRDLNLFLNTLCRAARVHLLEDPVEDFFVAPVVTPAGEERLFQGRWEDAALRTEAVLMAFLALPEAPQSLPAVRGARALLRLGSAIAARAGLAAHAVGSGSPGAAIVIPADDRLSRLSARVSFTAGDLAAIGLSRDELAPFILDHAHFEGLRAAAPGTSRLEAQPIIAIGSRLVVAAPANLSTAARAVLIDAVVADRATEAFLERLLHYEADLIDQGGWLPFGRAERWSDDGQPNLQLLWSPSPGRYVHALLLTVDLEGWPDVGFETPVPFDSAWGERLVEAIRSVKARAGAKGPVVDGMSFVICGGWGGARRADLELPDDLADWPIEWVPASHAMALGSLSDGRVEDIWRLLKQRRALAEQGFEFENPNGLLNLFAQWRSTDFALLPAEVALEPPFGVLCDAGLLVEPRREAAYALGRRVLPWRPARGKLVQRLEPRPVGPLEPIYASRYDAYQRRLVGAATHEDAVWWIELASGIDDPQPRHSFETWKAALAWAARLLAALPRVVPKRLRAHIAHIRLEIVWPGAFGEAANPDDAVVGLRLGDTQATVRLEAAWHGALHHADNRAELTLAAALLEAAAHRIGWQPSAEVIDRVVRAAAGSSHTRYRHSFEAVGALEMLASSGLVEPFRAPSRSASALVSCGAAFAIRPRAAGATIDGKPDCVGFLELHAAMLLETLRRSVGWFDRPSIVRGALTALQAALHEQRHWQITAPALRALHGATGDFEISLARVRETNAVIRAASMLVEIGAVEAAVSGGQAFGPMDFDELSAMAIQHFLALDTLAAIRLDRMAPRLRISSTGSVRFDASFEESTLAYTSQVRHQADRRDAEASYVERFEAPAGGAIDAGLREALAAEFGDFDAVVDLTFVPAMLAAERGEGVVIARRSEIVAALERLEPLADKPVAALIDRLTLAGRRGWEDVPAPLGAADFDLSRFDRPHSLIARPVPALSPGPDPQVAFAPAVIERSIRHYLSGAMTGGLQGRIWESPLMRSHAGRIAEAVGIEFNREVAAAIGALGLRTWAGAKPAWCLNAKADDAMKSYGDVDVLAVDSSGRHVWVVEAKDLKLCRTLGESARRLSEYRGLTLPDGKPDKLLRHLRRVELLRDNAAALCGRLGIEAPPAVHGVVVVRAPQPMERAGLHPARDARCVHLDDIGEVPWTTGWRDG